MPQVRFTPEKAAVRFTPDEPTPIEQPSTPAPTPQSTIGDYVKAAGLGALDPFAGIGSGVFNTALGASHLVNRATGGRLGVPSSVTLSDIGIEPQNAIQKLGMVGEQAAAFMDTGGAIGRDASTIAPT